MLDLNTGSGAQYGGTSRSAGLSAALNGHIDAALIAKNKAQVARSYVSTSGLGRECMRQIQYDFMAAPKDPEGEFEPSTLRIFEAGHRSEDIVADWLRMAGFELRTHRQNGRQYGFEALNGRFKGHIDGVILSGPPDVDLTYPCLWENKALGINSWRDVVKRGVTVSKPVYAGQIAVYQAYLNLPNPALFTAHNRDTWEIYPEAVPFDSALAQRMSDRAVQVVKASAAQDLLPRIANDPASALCKGGRTGGGFHGRCSWYDLCWGKR